MSNHIVNLRLFILFNITLTIDSISIRPCSSESCRREFSTSAQTARGQLPLLTLCIGLILKQWVRLARSQLDFKTHQMTIVPVSTGGSLSKRIVRLASAAQKVVSLFGGAFGIDHGLDECTGFGCVRADDVRTTMQHGTRRGGLISGCWITLVEEPCELESLLDICVGCLFG